MTDPGAKDAASHYYEAEYWLNVIKGLHARRMQRYRTECIAKAQVHATLAVAAAAIRHEQPHD